MRICVWISDGGMGVSDLGQNWGIGHGVYFLLCSLLDSLDNPLSLLSFISLMQWWDGK